MNMCAEPDIRDDCRLGANNNARAKKNFATDPGAWMNKRGTTDPKLFKPAGNTFACSGRAKTNHHLRSRVLMRRVKAAEDLQPLNVRRRLKD